MHFSAVNHHLILMLQRYLNENVIDKGYKVLLNPESFSLSLPEEGRIEIKPAMAVIDLQTEEPVLIADLDLQACGRQEYFTEKIQQYAKSRLKEHWLFYTKDHIIVVRKREGDVFSKPVIFEEAELLRRGGLFPSFDPSI